MRDPLFGVYHHAWKLGGATWIAVDAVRSLCNLGFSPVEIISIVRPHEEVEKALNRTNCISNYTILFKKRFYRAVLAMRSIMWIPIKKVLKKYNNIRGLWLDYSTYKPILGLARSKNVKILEYIYFPYEILINKKLYERVPDELKSEVEGYFYMYKIYKSRRIYLKTILHLENRFRRNSPTEDADAVLTVSRWTAKIVRSVYGGDPIPNEPAVETSVFQRYSGLSYEEREPRVVTIGRISPEKRFELILEGASLSETKPEILIVGALSKSKIKYYNKIKELAKKYKLNVNIKTNLPRVDLAEHVGKSLVYVHSTVGEHFGIGVVEGMAAGLPVVVHASGGPYHDIIQRGEYGLYYDSPEGLAEHIDKLFSDRKIWNYYHNKSIERVSEYSFEMYVERLKKGLRRAGII